MEYKYAIIADFLHLVLESYCKEVSHSFLLISKHVWIFYLLYWQAIIKVKQAISKFILWLDNCHNNEWNLYLELHIILASCPKILLSYSDLWSNYSENVQFERASSNYINFSRAAVFANSLPWSQITCTFGLEAPSWWSLCPTKIDHGPSHFSCRSQSSRRWTLRQDFWSFSSCSSQTLSHWLENADLSQISLILRLPPSSP